MRGIPTAWILYPSLQESNTGVIQNPTGDRYE
jgi:hypothetical protein